MHELVKEALIIRNKPILLSFCSALVLITLSLFSYAADLSRTEVIALLKEADRDHPAPLRRKDLKGVDLTNFDFRYADLKGVNLSVSKIQDTIFDGTDVAGARFNKIHNKDGLRALDKAKNKAQAIID